MNDQLKIVTAGFKDKIIELKSETGDKTSRISESIAKLEKGLALFENSVELGTLMVRHVLLTSPKPKRIFRKRNRCTKKFIKQQQLINVIKNAALIRQNIIQQRIIQSQPIPKFERGKLK